MSTTVIRKNFWEDVKNNPQTDAHIIMIATKPDIIKQAPLYTELKKRGKFVILIHTGQHYDYTLSQGVLEEFDMTVDIQLNISGILHEKFSQVIHRLGDILVKLSDEYKKLPIPYVHGDTMTAATADKAAFLNKCAVVHVEAGIRTFTPIEHFYHRVFTDFSHGNFDWDFYYGEMQNQRIYELGSIEPWPEQFDTRSIEPSTGYFAIPVDLYKDTLRGEGFSEDRMEVVGNTVADAVKISCQKIPESKTFEIYPNMKGKKPIFITIHRRENCEVKERFLAIYFGIKKLIVEGYPVCFLELNASKTAIDNFGLREDLNRLIEKYPDNFAYGPALAHHHEVMDMLDKAGCVMTDSGSMQEEANIMSVPCVTVRFGSDRSETLLVGANVIAPPVNSNLIATITKHAYDNPNMRKGNIYGENVSAKIVDGVERILKKDKKLFRFDHEKFNFSKYFNWEI
ncbi:UDP-N-acetylglucosamine 2-epimerase [Candidatus Gracilibacteria bacterium]|nr:UDP-N-acetylglucosamine 2-epimerase [Candidatus Gracilibacteria bacterium]